MSLVSLHVYAYVSIATFLSLTVHMMPNIAPNNQRFLLRLKHSTLEWMHTGGSGGAQSVSRDRGNHGIGQGYEPGHPGAEGASHLSSYCWPHCFLANVINRDCDARDSWKRYSSKCHVNRLVKRSGIVWILIHLWISQQLNPFRLFHRCTRQLHVSILPRSFKSLVGRWALTIRSSVQRLRHDDSWFRTFFVW